MRIKLKNVMPEIPLIFEKNDNDDFQVKENIIESDAYFTLDNEEVNLKESIIICPNVDNDGGFGDTSNPWGQLWSQSVKSHSGIIYALAMVNGNRPYIKIEDDSLIISHDGITEYLVRAAYRSNDIHTNVAAVCGENNDSYTSDIYIYNPSLGTWNTIPTSIDPCGYHTGFDITTDSIGITHRITSSCNVSAETSLYNIPGNIWIESTDHPIITCCSISRGFPLEEIAYVFCTAFDYDTYYETDLYDKEIITKFSMSDETWTMLLFLDSLLHWRYFADQTCEYISSINKIIIGVDETSDSSSCYFTYDRETNVFSLLYTSIYTNYEAEPSAGAFPYSILKYSHPNLNEFNVIDLTEDIKSVSPSTCHEYSCFTDVVMDETYMYLLGGYFNTCSSTCEVYNYTTDTFSIILDLPTELGLDESYNTKM